MKQQLKPLVASLCLLGLMVIPVQAIAEQSSPALEQQVANLQQEVAALKQQMRPAHNRSHRAAHRHNPRSTTGLTKPELKTTEEIASLVNRAEAGERRADAQQPGISGPQYLPQSGIQYLPVDVDVPGQSFVSTGPYIGVPLQYSGSNLIVNNPSVNQDVALLNLRKNINQRLAALGLTPHDEHSHLLLSGVVEGQAIYRDIGHGPDSSDIDLTSAGIDAYILGPSTWTSGLISISYDNNIGAQTGSLSTNARTQNSRLFVNKAFITVGDFSQSPFYGTIGQMYVPFGTYSTTMVSSPLTKLLFRTQERAILLGYQQQGPCAFYASGYTFKGDSFVGSTSRVNNGGVNAGYRFDRGFITGNIGGGVIANVADSQGMQNTGTPVGTPLLFGGFGGPSGSGNEQIQHRVAGYNMRGLLSFGKSVDFLIEYISATSRFSTLDMTLNGHGAKPQALNTELAYSFQALPKPVSISVGYGMAKDALAVGLPLNRYSFVVNTSLWRNTLQSLEFRHDKNYAASNTATGSTVIAPSASGQSDSIVTAQFDIYF